jgi:hypothetical protein
MANKIAINYDTTQFVIDNIKMATNYQTKLTNTSKCTIATTVKYAFSDCKYFQNPGFVCPLKAYRADNLFFILG